MKYVVFIFLLCCGGGLLAAETASVSSSGVKDSFAGVHDLDDMISADAVVYDGYATQARAAIHQGFGQKKIDKLQEAIVDVYMMSLPGGSGLEGARRKKIIGAVGAWTKDVATYQKSVESMLGTMDSETDLLNAVALLHNAVK